MGKSFNSENRHTHPCIRRKHDLDNPEWDLELDKRRRSSVKTAYIVKSHPFDSIKMDLERLPQTFIETPLEEEDKKYIYEIVRDIEVKLKKKMHEFVKYATLGLTTSIISKEYSEILKLKYKVKSLERENESMRRYLKANNLGWYN